MTEPGHRTEPAPGPARVRSDIAHDARVRNHWRGVVSCSRRRAAPGGRVVARFGAVGRRR